MPENDLCWKHSFSDAAFYDRRSKFEGLQVNEAKRLKALETENPMLNRLLTKRTWTWWRPRSPLQ